MGALKAAARPAAAPMGANRRRRRRERRRLRGRSWRRRRRRSAARIFRTEGVAAARAKAEVRNLPMTVRTGNVAVVDIEGGLGLIDAAAAGRREEHDNQGGDDESGNTWGTGEAELAGRGASRGSGGEPLDGDAESDTSRPERTPMKMERTRKRRSSRVGAMRSMVAAEGSAALAPTAMDQRWPRLPAKVRR